MGIDNNIRIKHWASLPTKRTIYQFLKHIPKNKPEFPTVQDEDSKVEKVLTGLRIIEGIQVNGSVKRVEHIKGNNNVDGTHNERGPLVWATPIVAPLSSRHLWLLLNFPSSLSLSVSMSLYSFLGEREQIIGMFCGDFGWFQKDRKRIGCINGMELCLFWIKYLLIK